MSFNYDLSDVLIGFGKVYSAPAQEHVIKGFQVTFDLKSELEIAEFEEFAEQLKGAAVGFWFPNPMAVLEVVQWADAKTFKIKDQRLRTAWQTRPDVHLLFVKRGQTPLIGTISNVTLAGGSEVVQLATEFDAPLDETWSVCRLQYVRLAGDTESWTWIGEQRQRRTIRVVELPHEYAAQETGSQPIYLYKIWLETDPPTEWFYTSFEQNVASGGDVYIAKPISHGGLRESVRGDREETVIESFREDNNPFTLFLPFPVSRRMYVQIVRTSFPEPNVTEVLFTGRVMFVDFDGNRMTARCSSFLDAFDNKVPGFLISPICNYAFGDPKTCKAPNPGRAGTITKIAGNVIQVQSDYFNPIQEPVEHTRHMPNHWAGGRIEVGSGAEFETRLILSNSGTTGVNEIRFTLDLPLVYAEEGSDIKVFAGCDGTSETCQNKHNNFINFGGHRVPLHNLTLKAMERQNAHGNKK